MEPSQIQERLIERGYDIGVRGADGDVGAETIAAVVSFQRANGLVPDGIAGPLTIAALSRDKDPPLVAEPRVPNWIVLARADLGTLEGVGESNNPRVISYFVDAGFSGVKEDAVAWCAAFVGAQLKRAGIRPSLSLAARSYERWGVGIQAPAFGCVATKRRGGSSWQGHVGFVVGANDKKVFLLSGNQDDAVSIATYPRAEFTAFRWPSEVPLTQNVLPKTIAGARAAGREV
ncbi:NlpC/P60 family protein [Tardiphaga sp. 20_F10_N6_6]|uniref:NlpC/P60 family protein n=1 Tax=Tardiphaga sp. 20_F10_N6_6 TaxID=3240788 RepID=UPI003F888481